MKSNDDNDDNDLYNSRMFDEYSLADSQTLGTGYIVKKDANDGSVSMITDDLVDESTRTSNSDNALQTEFSGWNVFGNLFSRSPESSSKKITSKSKRSIISKMSNTNQDEFEDNVNNLYGNADFYFNSHYNGSSRRLRYRKMFHALSDTNMGSKRSQLQQHNHQEPSHDGSNPNNNQPAIGENEIIVDFLKDDPSEMTWGRRIALNLMKYSWYYPQAQKDNEDDIIDKDMLDVTRNHSGAEILRTISNDEKNTENDRDKHDIEQVEVYHNDTTTSAFLAPTSLEKAWAYFEHITLPRYVYEERKDSSMIHSCVNPKGAEIAESGERYFKTRLYHPFFTPLNQLGEFGLGIALYFTTLRTIMLLLFLVGLINIPNLLYFAGSEYSSGQPGVFWPLRGSAVCTDYEFVPCVDCNEQNFEYARERLRSITSEDGEELTFALKNNCDGATETTIMTNLATMLVMVIGLTLISFFVSREEAKFDEVVQSSQDYSIVITNPPTDAGDVLEWREYFSNKFDNVHVACCTVAVHNEILLRALVKRRELLHILRKKLPPGESLEKDNLDIITEDMRDERCCGSFYGVPALYESLLELEEKIKLLLVKNKPVVSVFITFETESSQRQVLKKLRKEAAKGKSFDRKYAFREGHQALKVKEAAEPSAVRWQDLSEPMSAILTSLIFPYIITALAMYGSATLTRYVRRGFWIFPASPSNAALVITIGNIVFPFVARALTNLEVHRREGHKETSLYIKYAMFRWVNTVVVTALITPSTSTLMSGERDTLVVIYNIFFYQIVFAGLPFLDLIQNLKRHVFAPRAKTQEDMNTLMGGKELDIAERYSSLTTTLFLTLCYCSLYPAVLFFGGVSILVTLIADKFCLMRSWAPSPRLGGIISRINTQLLFPITLITMLLTSSYAWYGFNYDNLCVANQTSADELGYSNETFNIPSFSNSEVEDEISLSSDSLVYKYCDQSSWAYIIPILPSINRYSDIEWMSIKQKFLTEIFSWVAISLIATITISVSYRLGYTFGKKYKSIDLKKFSFSESGANAYIPEVQSSIIPFPLIGCSVYEVANPHLFEWSSPYHPHSYYDLTLDAADVMKESDKHIAEFAFSRVRYWEAPVM